MAASGSGAGAVFDEDIDEEYRVREYIPNPNGDDRYSEENLRNLFHKEKTFYQNRLEQCIKSARRNAIDWIIKRRSQFKFKFHTAYITVTYIDRYLHIKLVMEDHKAIGLLSLACLSLAVKLEESRKVDVSNISFGDYKFPSSSIETMEEEVSRTLERKMDSVTPFHFIGFFVPKCCKECPKKDVVVATVEAIFATIRDTNYMAHLPSVIAIAAMLVAMDRNINKTAIGG